METVVNIRHLVSTLASVFGARTEPPRAAETAPRTPPDDQREVDGATMARWIALIGAGNQEVAQATASAAAEALRSNNEYLLWQMLADADLAVYADWKDDDSVAA